jgi:hypothetical protein
MCLTALAGGWLAGQAAARTKFFFDASQHGNYLAGYRLPIHVVQEAYPGWPVVICIWAMLAVLALLGLGFGRRVAALGRSGLVWLVGGQAAVGLCLTFFPIVQAGDIYYYAIYGRLFGVYGANPYAIAAPLSGHDPVIGPCLAFLTSTPTSDPYGPLWTIIAGALMRAETTGSLWLAVWSYRVAAVAAALAVTGGVAYALRRLGDETRISRAAFVAFNPLMLYESAVGGHNDSWMVAAAVWAFAVVDDVPLVAGLLLGAAIAIKIVAAVTLPFLALRAWRRHGSGAVLVLAIAGLVPYLCDRPFAGQAGSAAFARVGSSFSGSIDWLANIAISVSGHTYGPAFPWLPALPLLGEASWPRLVQVSVLAAFAVVAVVSAVRYALLPRFGDLWRTVAALLWSVSSMHPWYGQWIVPAVAGADAWATYARCYTALLLGNYVLDGIAAPAKPLLAPVLTTLAFLIVPIVVARWHRPPQRDLRHVAG